MCGRYTDEACFSDIRLTFDVADRPSPFPWVPRFNIAPSHGAGYEQPFIVREGEERVAHLGRWWLIPSWWKKELKQLPTAFNARSEEISAKPHFRDAFRSARCLVPATGWREYVPAGKAKQPYHFHLGHALFAFAGLCSRWVSPDSERSSSPR
jgi:putative SOS response-associated peptidase YedK